MHEAVLLENRVRVSARNKQIERSEFRFRDQSQWHILETRSLQEIFVIPGQQECVAFVKRNAIAEDVDLRM